MKLYIKPGACSLSPHIVMLEAGLRAEIVEVDLATKKTKDGGDYRAVNPKGSVPALVLDDGQVVTEGAVIVQYLADQAPASKLAPAAGTIERYRLQEWLNYIGTEVHKTFSPLFNPACPEEWKRVVRETLLPARFDLVSQSLAGKDWLMGATFTVADAYLFTVLGWAPRVGIALDRWPALTAYRARVAARPAVQAALKAEGL